MERRMMVFGAVLQVMAAFGVTVSEPVTATESGYLPELVLDNEYAVGHAVSLWQDPQSAAPTKVTINAGGVLRLTDITSRLVAPLDLDIAAGGQVVFPHGENGVYARSTLIAHRLTWGGRGGPVGRLRVVVIRRRPVFAWRRREVRRPVPRDAGAVQGVFRKGPVREDCDVSADEAGIDRGGGRGNPQESGTSLRGGRHVIH